MILYIKPCLKSPEIVSLRQLAAITMAQMAQHPPGLTPTKLCPDPGNETQDLLMTTPIKKTNDQSMDSQKDLADVPESKVPEYDMTAPNYLEHHAETEVDDQDLAEIFKENPGTSGPVLVMP